MRTKVTENGVLIPKALPEGIDEVDIQKTQNIILVVPVQADDPILNLGKQPIRLDVEDASVNHDELCRHGRFNHRLADAPRPATVWHCGGSRA